MFIKINIKSTPQLPSSQMKKIITSAAIVLFSSASNAEWKKLDCIDNTNFTVYIQFDEQAQAVKLGDE